MNTILLRGRSMFLLSILLLLIFLFVFLQPTLAAYFNTSHRHQILKDFIATTKIENQVEGQSFWQTREFYHPGSFKYSHGGFPLSEVRPLLLDMSVRFTHTNNLIAFLTYRSNKWQSAEFLVDSPNIAAHISDDTAGKDIVIKTETSWMYYEDENTLKIIFTKNIDDMQKANGFFDYPGHDKEYLKDKYWLSISEVQL